MWIETVCEDEEIIKKNIKELYLEIDDKIKQEAFADLNKVFDIFNRYYETIQDNEYNKMSYVKLINVGDKMIISNMKGYLQSKIVIYVKNLYLYPKTIYLTRHGESVFIPEERIGGDPDLSENGKIYAKQLNNFMNQEFSNVDLNDENKKPIIATSTLERAKKTANELELNSTPVSLKNLDEINVGLYDSMSFQEVNEKYPERFKERQADKLRIRFPKGENYLDLIHRLEPIIFSIEKAYRPVIIVAHQAVLRCLYAYLTKYEVEEIPNLDMPLNTLIKLIPATYFCEEIRLHKLLKSIRYKFDLKNDRITQKVIQKPEIITDFFKNI